MHVCVRAHITPTQWVDGILLPPKHLHIKEAALTMHAARRVLACAHLCLQHELGAFQPGRHAGEAL